MEHSSGFPADTVISPMHAGHLNDLADIESAAFSKPWSRNALAEELQNPLAVFYVAEDTDTKRAVGYAGMHHILDEGYITNIVINTGYRRKGIARALIGKLTEYAHSHELTRITLEVRVSNTAAISLYENFRFQRDGIRPNFYDSPKEDAVIYSLYF